MQQLSEDFKSQVSAKLIEKMQDRQVKDAGFYTFYGINESTTIKMRKGDTGQIMQDYEWLRLGRKLGLFEAAHKWNVARTEVFNTIEEDILFCQQNAKAKICVDECGIGKTFTAKYLSKSLNNCFYVDASQGKSTLLFTQILARSIGLPVIGKHQDIKEDIKCYLQILDKPVVIIDEAGDLTQLTIQEIKEFWNATEGYCGWYLMGANGLRYIIEKGIKNKKPGFEEIFSRFSNRYTKIVPVGKDDKIAFYKTMIKQVLEVNLPDKSNLNELVKKCLIQDTNGHISGLRRAESLLILHS